MRSLRDLTQHLTTRADDSHAAPVLRVYCYTSRLSPVYRAFQTQVRFFALHRIKPHAPLLVRAPVNSFEFQPCDRTSQVGYLMRWLRHRALRRDIEYPSFRAWTTRVSNPVCYPRFRVSASVAVQRAVYTAGVPPDIYAFHRYTRNSPLPCSTQGSQYPGQSDRLSRWISPWTCESACLPFTPSNSGQRSDPTYYRGCWHVVSRGFL